MPLSQLQPVHEMREQQQKAATWRYEHCHQHLSTAGDDFTGTEDVGVFQAGD
jgi:hypothetical protein